MSSSPRITDVLDARLADVEAGSLVVLCGRGAAEIVDRKPGVTYAAIVFGEPQGDEIEASSDNFVRTVLEPIQERVFGRVLNRPHVHLLIDVLVVSSPADHALVNFLRPYLHPAGLIVTEEPIPELGSAREISARYVYLPGKNPEEIYLAKLHPTERRWLHDRAIDLAPGSTFVEIGSYVGGSCIIAALANPDIRIYGVDPWAAFDDSSAGGNFWEDIGEFRRNTQFLRNVTPIQIDPARPEEGVTMIAAHESCRDEELEINFLFVDGMHTYEAVSRDLSIYAPHLRGSAAGHDYLRPGVARAVDQYFARGIRRLLALRAPERVWDSRLRSLMRPPEVLHFDEWLWAVERLPLTR